jgi:hypothetical protein
MTLTEIKPLIEMAATIIGISAGVIGLYKYFSDKRGKELREWQKVVIYKVLRQNETEPMRFTDILDRYRSEAQAFVTVDLRKNEVSEDALRRVLLELAGSDIVSLEPNDSFLLKLEKTQTFSQARLEFINQELVRVIAPNPFVYTLDEFVKEVSSKIGMPMPLLRNWIKQSVSQGGLEIDSNGRLAFPK